MEVLVFNQSFVKTFWGKACFLKYRTGVLTHFKSPQNQWNLFISISTVAYLLFLLTQDKISIDTELIRNIAELLPFRRRRRCYRLGPFVHGGIFCSRDHGLIWTQNKVTLFRFFYLCFLMCIRLWINSSQSVLHVYVYRETHVFCQLYVEGLQDIIIIFVAHPFLTHPLKSKFLKNSLQPRTLFNPSQRRERIFIKTGFY